jgi:outer membrane receptor for ferrienterochelin and colicin
MMSYQTLENLAFFVNNIDEPQKFDVDYFTNNTNILDFSGELNITLSNALNLDSKISLKQYKNDIEENAWLLPTIVLNSNATFKINDKLKITGDLLFQGDTKAKILTYRYDGTNPTVPTGIDTNIKTIKAFADFSTGASYQYNKKVTGFIKVNNLLGNDYQRYAYYQNFGVNILGGLSYGF